MHEDDFAPGEFDGLGCDFQRALRRLGWGLAAGGHEDRKQGQGNTEDQMVPGAHIPCWVVEESLHATG